MLLFNFPTDEVLQLPSLQLRLYHSAFQAYDFAF